MTSADTPTERRWTLSGELVGPWAAELMSDWERARTGLNGKHRLVDLTEITFIDEGGEKVLRVMKSESAEFVVRGVANQYLVARLKQRSKCPLRRCMAYLSKEGSKENK